ncbi:MAG TPA: CHASE2 domain-containing protein, partial [Verrucomicrobiales bacterium]|nr:CHASE2 domain-containing protein [Verrucomicrobiales bacterium]
VGYVATGSYDTLNTPIGPMPGLVVHANLLSNLWSGQHLWLPPFWLEMVILPIFGLAAGAVMTLRRKARLAGVLVLGLAALAICLAAAKEDIMLPMAGLAGTWGVLLCAAGLLKNTLTNPEGLAPAPSLPKVLLPKIPQTGSTGLSRRVSHPPSIRNPELPVGMDSNDAETVQMDATVTWQSPAREARSPDEKISPAEENTSLQPPAP